MKSTTSPMTRTTTRCYAMLHVLLSLLLLVVHVSVYLPMFVSPGFFLPQQQAELACTVQCHCLYNMTAVLGVTAILICHTCNVDWCACQLVMPQEYQTGAAHVGQCIEVLRCTVAKVLMLSTLKGFICRMLGMAFRNQLRLASPKQTRTYWIMYNGTHEQDCACCGVAATYSFAGSLWTRTPTASKHNFINKVK